MLPNDNVQDMLTRTANLPSPTVDDVVVPVRGSAVTWVVSSTGLAVVPVGVLHVSGAAQVHPLLDPVSYYALIPGGYFLLLLGCVLLGMAGLGLGLWLLRSGLPGARLPAALLASFAAAFTLVGLFPTDPWGTEVMSASALIHRIGAAWGVVVVPLAGVLVARCTATTACRACAARLVLLAKGVAGLTVTFFAIHIPLALMGSRIPAFGLLERAGFALVIGSLVLMALAIRCRDAGELQHRRGRALPTS